MNPILVSQLDNAQKTGPGQRPKRESTFLQATVKFGDEDAVKLRVRNLSPGGMMVDFTSPPDVDTPVRVTIRGIGLIKGKVAWIRSGRAGIAFSGAIDPALARKPEQRSVDPEYLKKPTTFRSRRAPLRIE